MKKITVKTKEILPQCPNCKEDIKFLKLMKLMKMGQIIL